MYFESGTIDYCIVLEDVTYFLVFMCMLWNEYVFLASEERLYGDTNLKDFADITKYTNHLILKLGIILSNFFHVPLMVKKGGGKGCHRERCGRENTIKFEALEGPMMYFFWTEDRDWPH